MESTERPPLNVPSCGALPRGKSRGRRGRRLGSAAAAALLVLQQILVASLATAWPAVFAQLTSDTDASLRLSEEGSACNTTLYVEWYESPYSGALLVDLVDFWIFSDAELTNGQVYTYAAREAASGVYCRCMVDMLSAEQRFSVDAQMTWIGMGRGPTFS